MPESSLFEMASNTKRPQEEPQRPRAVDHECLMSTATVKA
jgi:hypothetical protein